MVLICALRHLTSGPLNLPPCFTHTPYTPQLPPCASAEVTTWEFAYEAHSNLCISLLMKCTLGELIRVRQLPLLYRPGGSYKFVDLYLDFST